jgi:hypothetical protein
MRRSILMVLGMLAIALAVPSAALAHRGRGHHHHKAQAHHQAKLRFMHIGASGTSVTGSPTSTTTPTTPATPTTTPPPENAGMVKSYTGGVLTLTLNDGSTVSGKVTEDTAIRCVKATPTTTTGTPGQPTDQGAPDDDNGQGDDQSRGDRSQQGDKGSSEWQHDDQGAGGDDDEEEVQGPPEPPCDSSALVAGAVVRSAELRIGPSGNEFENILLVR